MEFARWGFGEGARKSVCECSHLQCKCLQASNFIRPFYTCQAFFVCPLIAKVQSFQCLPQCCLSFQSWFKIRYWRLCFILGLKIPSDSLSSHRPLKFISLSPATNCAWYQRRINAAGRSALWKWNRVVCYACSCSLVIMWSVFCLNIYSILAITWASSKQYSSFICCIFLTWKRQQCLWRTWIDCKSTWE